MTTTNISIQVNQTGGNSSTPTAVMSLAYTNTTDGVNGQPVAAPAAEANLDLSAFVDVRYVMIRNTHASLSVDVGMDDSSTLKAPITLAPEDIAIFPVHSANTLRVKGISGDATLEVIGIEA